MKQSVLLAWLAMIAPVAAGESLTGLPANGRVGLELRFRFEDVEQADKPLTARADTLRLRLKLATGRAGPCSAFAEIDRVQALGAEHYDDTRNGATAYPVVADPEGTDLNQAWAQCQAPGSTIFRLGRQRVLFDGERFVGGVGWRQNEQTYDSFRIESRAVAGLVANYVYVGRVRRVFGPDHGTPPASLDGSSHLLNLKFESLPFGSLTLYGYRLDFDNAPQLSSLSLGAHVDGSRELKGAWTLGAALEYARQKDAGANAARIDAHYGLVELRLASATTRLALGRENLSGRAGSFAAAANPAFQTPLATLHLWQGWADKFATTPSAGVVDTYVGLKSGRGAWTAQATWHDFAAQATDASYGSEIDLLLSRRIGRQYELLAKLADYRANGLFTDTRKFWLQVSASW